MANLTAECREWNQDYTPCDFPYTTLLDAFRRPSGADDDDDVSKLTECSLTWSQSTGRLHLVSCVVQVLCMLAISLSFFLKFRQAHQESTTRRRAMSNARNAVSPRAHRSSSSCEWMRPCRQLNAASSFQLMGCIAALLAAVGCIDVKANADRMPLWLYDLILEICVNIVTTMVFTVVTSWARTFRAVNSSAAESSKQAFRIDALFYLMVTVQWVGSLGLQCYSSFSKIRPGVYNGNLLSVKHIVTGVPPLIYGCWSVRLYQLLSEKMRDATAAAGGSSVRRKPTNSEGKPIISQEERVRRQIRQYLIAIWLFLIVMVMYKCYASFVWFLGRTYYLSPPCSVGDCVELPYLMGLVVGLSWACIHRGGSGLEPSQIRAAMGSFSRQMSSRISRAVSFRAGGLGNSPRSPSKGFGAFMSPRSESTEDKVSGSYVRAGSKGGGLKSSRGLEGGSMDEIVEGGEDEEEQQEQGEPQKPSAAKSNTSGGSDTQGRKSSIDGIGVRVSEAGTDDEEAGGAARWDSEAGGALPDIAISFEDPGRGGSSFGRASSSKKGSLRSMLSLPKMSKSSSYVGSSELKNGEPDVERDAKQEPSTTSL